MNLELVENILALIGEFPVSEIEVSQEGQRVHVRRPLAAARPIADAAPATMAPAGTGESAGPVTEEAAIEAQTLAALMVGIFHQADPPLPYAATVRPGQVVGYIESMKLMNDVVAEVGGHVVDILVEDGAPVEYGQALFRLVA